jgi:phosphinothricin acetyltransferase
MIRPVMPQDVATLCAIYNHYIANTIITFEEVAVTEVEFAARVTKVQQAELPWIVAEEAGKLVGYAYASPWKERSAYRFSVEVTVYLAPDCTGRGWGTRLYEALFAELKRGSVRVAIGGVALPNPASVALHEKFGTQVAHFRDVGFKFGTWIDVAYWQTDLHAQSSSEQP